MAYIYNEEEPDYRNLCNRWIWLSFFSNCTDENTIAYSYDYISRVVAVINVLDGTASYAFDRNSNLISAIDVRKQKVIP